MEETKSAFVDCPFCGKTNPSDRITCSCGYFFDKQAYEEKQEIEDQIAVEQYENNSEFAFEKNLSKTGIIGGLGIIALAIIWLVVGLAADRLFFYPIILLIVGIFALIKGVFDNAGRRKIIKSKEPKKDLQYQTRKIIE